MGDVLRFDAAIRALQEDVKAVERAREHLDDMIAQRDAAIRDAADGGSLSLVKLARITGLSRNRLWTIVNSGSGGTA